jgi:hypothetical protein
MAEFIEFLSPSALKDLQTANAELVTMISNVDKVGTKMKGITTPSGSDSAIKGLTAEYQKQEKAIVNLQNKVVKANEMAQRQAEKTRLAEIKLAQQREKAFDNFDKNALREQAKLNASLNLYNKTQQQLNKITASYNDLITRKLRYNNLSDNEEKRLLTLQRVTERYNTTLKAVDATIGKNQRNVGNYASAFNPLSNSINQLTREMPAFTYSVQTGFMALSNNIPIFTDAIGNAIAQNKALQAEGKPTTSVLSQLAGAFLSWQTLMGVGITLLTVYGKEIGTFIEQAFKSSKAVDGIKESQKQLNEINLQGRKNAVEETLNLKSLLAIAKDTNLSYRERKIAVDQLQTTYPAYFGNLKQEQILAGNTAIAERQLTDAILSRAKANAAVAKITENQGAIIDIDEKLLVLSKDLTSAEILQANAIKNVIKVNRSRGDSEAFQAVQTAGNVEEIKKKIKVLQEEKKIKEDINNRISQYAIEKQKEAILLDYKEEKTIKEKTKAKKEDIEVLQETSKSYDSLLYRLEDAKRKIEDLQKGTSRSSSEWRFYQDAIDKVSKSIDILKNGFPELRESAKNVTDGLEFQQKQAEKNAETLAKLKQATDDYIATFANGFLGSRGLGSMQQFFDGTFQQRLESITQSGGTMQEKFALYFNAIAESAQEAFSFIENLSNQRFANEYANLEQQKEVALLFAGESATAREEIERQYETRQREIKRREFQAKKQQAIFNIVIDTAQGVVSALASTPPNVPLSIAIGAIGAVQAGLVASQQVPQFWKGTDNAPEGWALTQERGREIITDSKGNIKSLGNDKGAQYTYLNKGDKVLDNNKTMDYLMFNNDLNAMLTSNDIAMPKVNIEMPKIDLTPVIDAINNKESVSLNIGKDGLDVYVRNGHTTKEILNRKVNFVGKSV